jgi:ketose-bisphosphate aldolase
MNLTEKLKDIRLKKKAILAANFYNLETLQGVLQAATQLKAPVILQLSESSINYIGLKTAVSMARSVINDYGTEAWIHLDHGGSVDLVARCLDAGFDSVMIDASEKPFEENVKTTLQVVNLALQYKANVEAELGYIAKLGQAFDKGGFTSPEDAKKFVAETNVNALAVAIGSAHGFYKQAPKLEIELLAKISATVDVPLVLHGSSGIPDAMLRDAIKHGITKINLATETKNIFMQTLKSVLAETDEIDLRKVFPHATQSVVHLISDKIKAINLVDAA